MHYYIDTEFIDDGKTIDLISIGIVSGDGREYYAQSTEFTIDKASPWVREHVLMHLKLCPSISTPSVYSLGTVYGAQSRHKQGQCVDQWRERIHNCPWRTREQIAHEVKSFIGDDIPEFHAWCAGYDWVVLCQLFGAMMDLPSGWPHYIRDLQYVLDERGITDEMLPPQEEQSHNALADARYIQKIWQVLDGKR